MGVPVLASLHESVERLLYSLCGTLGNRGGGWSAE